MNYDKSSFLAGLAIGQQLKGWASARSFHGMPLHKGIVEGKVINRDILPFEVVHAIPQSGYKLFNGIYGSFIDDNNHGYTVQSNKLRIYDATDGTLIDNSMDAYRIEVFDGGTLAAVEHARPENEHGNEYTIIYRDGTTAEVTVPETFVSVDRCVWGARNGVLGCCLIRAYGLSLSYRLYAYSFNLDGSSGEYLTQITWQLFPYAHAVYPFSKHRLGVLVKSVVGGGQRDVWNYAIVTPGTSTMQDSLHLWGDYYPMSTAKDNQFTYIGADDEWFYGYGRMHDPGTDDLTDDIVMAKFSIAQYDGPKELFRWSYANEPQYFGILNDRKHIVREDVNDSHRQSIVEFPSLEPVYEDIIDDITMDSYKFLRETDDYLYFHSETYQFDPATGVIWADDTYPRAPSDDQLGYVSTAYKVDQRGRAYILFTQEEEEP